MKVFKFSALLHPLITQIFFYIHFMNPKRISYVTSAIYIPYYKVPETKFMVLILGIPQFPAMVLLWAQIVEGMFLVFIYIYGQALILTQAK
jgi:hypothetical protein